MLVPPAVDTSTLLFSEPGRIASWIRLQVTELVRHRRRPSAGLRRRFACHAPKQGTGVSDVGASTLRRLSIICRRVSSRVPRVHRGRGPPTHCLRGRESPSAHANSGHSRRPGSVSLCRLALVVSRDQRPDVAVRRRRSSPRPREPRATRGQAVQFGTETLSYLRSRPGETTFEPFPLTPLAQDQRTSTESTALSDAAAYAAHLRLRRR